MVQPMETTTEMLSYSRPVHNRVHKRARGLARPDRGRAASTATGMLKMLKDKALAIEMYARLAKNVEAEAQACEIRLRAERRAGQLLREMEKAKGGRPSLENPSRATTGLSDLGISRDQSSKWQKLAGIPEDDFEASLAAPGKPSTTDIIADHAAPSRSPSSSRPTSPPQPEQGPESDGDGHDLPAAGPWAREQG